MGESSSSISIGLETLAIALLVIAFYGEPDLIDALIHYFMRCGA